jgi:restriction system protein
LIVAARIYLQAKRYDPENPVGEPDIQKFCGSLGAKKAAKGVFLTTSYFTKPAVAFAEHHPYKIVLIDGNLLARLTSFGRRPHRRNDALQED